MKNNIVNPTKQRLIDEGLAFIAENGIRNLSIRKVAKRANVNLGSFVYYFKTREGFIHELLTLWYSNFYTLLDGDPNETQRPVLKMERMLLSLIDFMNQHEKILVQFYLDFLYRDINLLRFLSSLNDNFPMRLLKTIKLGQMSGDLVDGDPKEMLIYLLSPIVWPRFLFEATPVEEAKKTENDLSELNAAGRLFIDRQRTIHSIKWILNGITTDKGKADYQIFSSNAL